MLSFLGTTCFFCFEETERVVGWGCLELKFLFSRKLGAGKRIPEKFRKFFLRSSVQQMVQATTNKFASCSEFWLTMIIEQFC